MKMHSTTIFIVLFLAGYATASPKKYIPDDGGFQPSQVRYYESNLPQNSGTNATATATAEKQAKSDDGKESRFGISTYGTSGGYNNGGVSYGITPMKIDIGGIALGALIGLGAILIVPKLAQVFSHDGYGYRSLENDMSSVTDVLRKIDNTLEQNNIDSSSCMQRIICSTVHDAGMNMKNGEAGTTDQIILAISKNSIFSMLLDGSSIKQAIEMGQQEQDKCSNLYTKCPIGRENILKMISSVLPA